MEETLIKYDTAKLAKEKGFSSNLDNIIEYCYKLCEIQKWLREQFKIHIEISWYGKYQVDITAMSNKSSLKYDSNRIMQYVFKTHEEALEFALVEALKLLPNVIETNQ